MNNIQSAIHLPLCPLVIQACLHLSRRSFSEEGAPTSSQTRGHVGIKTSLPSKSPPVQNADKQMDNSRALSSEVSPESGSGHPDLFLSRSGGGLGELC